MKPPIHFLLCNASAIVLALELGGASSIRAQNLLADPSFESGTLVASGLGGWGTFNNASLSHDYTHGGDWSLKSPWFNNSNVAGFQIVTTTPGSLLQLSGWGFTPAPLVDGPGFLSHGYLGLVFLDSSQNIITTPQFFYEVGRLDPSTPAQIWTFLSGQVTAPATAAYVEVLASEFGGLSSSVVYYDDIQLTVVPEPACLSLLGGGMGLLFALRSRRS